MITNSEKSKRIQKHLSRYVQILQRCYNSECKSYKNYGAKGVTMCDEWLNSPDKFISWCESNGYDETKVLDKDILCDQLGIHPKIYSPKTCKFVTVEENRQHMLDNSIYQAIASYDKNGCLVKAYKSISGSNGANATNISRVVRGERLTAGGLYWRNVNSIEEAPKNISIPEPVIYGKAIIEIDNKGIEIGKYSNCVLAGEALGLRPSSISQVVNGHRNSLYGKFFKLANG